MADDHVTEQFELVRWRDIRQAITFSDGTSSPGEPSEIMTPYLEKAWKLAGSPPGGMDVQEPLMALLVCLAQMGGAAFTQLLSERAGRELTKAEVLAELDAAEYRFIAEGSGG